MAAVLSRGDELTMILTKTKQNLSFIKRSAIVTCMQKRTYIHIGKSKTYTNNPSDAVAGILLAK